MGSTKKDLKDIKGSMLRGRGRYIQRARFTPSRYNDRHASILSSVHPVAGPRHTGDRYMRLSGKPRDIACSTANCQVTDPLAANLLHARDACSSFQQTTNLLCSTTSTLLHTVILTAATTATTIQTVIVTQQATTSTTTTTIATVTPSATVLTRTVTTSLNANPSGPIPGSADINKRAADAIPCPRLISPDVPGPFAFFCQPSAFSSACRQVKILATTQTKQSTITVTANVTSTIRPVSVRTASTTVTTTATTNTTVVTTTTTTAATPTSTVSSTQTIVPGTGLFFLNARGATYNGPIGGTSTINAGDPLTLSDTGRYYFSMRIGSLQNLLTSFNPFGVYVAGNGDYVVRFSGYISGTDAHTLRCDLSQGNSGNLTCVSGDSEKTTLFQACNNDGKLYHGPGLLSGCSRLQLYSASA